MHYPCESYFLEVYQVICLIDPDFDCPYESDSEMICEDCEVVKE